ncbi:MAG: cytochrome C oxidase subunit IV family protein [Thermodesulfobacteriota bacterium]|jgi:cytochrome c oxidase subunit 4
MEAHPISPRGYFIVFGVLLVLTAVTVQVSFLDLGPFNAIVALAIAVSKALLVVLYFMHARYSPRLTQLVIGGGLLWFGILVAFTLSDYLTRDWQSLPVWGNWRATPEIPDWWGK